MAKFLANENVPVEAVQAARQQGHDLEAVGEIEPGASDDVVLDRARTSGRVLVTFDKDFGNLVFRGGRRRSRGVVLLRPRLRSPDYLARFLLDVLAQRSQWEGYFSVAQEGKLRVVRLPT
jgi:predicted nuclease of predicted toxin-antitoxin system